MLFIVFTVISVISNGACSPPSKTFDEEKALCKELSYDDLFKDTNRYRGWHVYYNGALLQVFEDDFFPNTYEMRAGTNGTSNDVYLKYYGDKLNAVPLYDDDNKLGSNCSRVEYVAIVQGTETYTTISGAERTIPLLKVIQIRVIPW